MKKKNKNGVILFMPHRLNRAEVCCFPCRINATGKTDHDSKTDTFDNRYCAGPDEQVFSRVQQQSTYCISCDYTQDPPDKAPHDPQDSRLKHEHTHHFPLLGTDTPHDAYLLD